METDLSLKKYGDLWTGKNVLLPPHPLRGGIVWHNVDYLVRNDQIQLQYTLWGKLVGYMNRRRIEIEGLRTNHYQDPMKMDNGVVSREQLTLL